MIETNEETLTCRCGGRFDARMIAYIDDAGTHGCWTCAKAYEAARKAARKAQLAALPRCEIPACKARGAYRIGPDAVLICGRHLTAAKAARRASIQPGMEFVAWASGFGWDRATILEALSK